MRKQMIVNPHLDGDSFFWRAGPVGILLCHGFTATTAEVRPLGKILYEQGYSVSGPLLPGHNTHPKELNQVLWQEWVTIVQTCYEELASHCEEILVGGESAGAILALHLAAHQPEISGILAYAPVLRLNLTKFDRIRLSLLAPFIPYVAKSNPSNNPYWMGYTVNPLKGVIQLLKLQKNVNNRLPMITQPLLIVQGRQDTTVHPSVPEFIQRNVKSSHIEIHWMEQSSHIVILDHELDQVARLTLNFIRNSVSSNSK